MVNYCEISVPPNHYREQQLSNLIVKLKLMQKHQ